MNANTAHAQWSLNGVKAYYLAGNVGIGTSDPAYALDVRSPGLRAIYGVANASSGVTFGMFGQSASPSGRGVMGLAAATTGVNIGVIGQSSSTMGVGVYGLGATTTGTNYGLYGRSNSPDGYAGFFAGNVGLTGWIGSKGAIPIDIYSGNTRVFRAQSASSGGVSSANIIGGFQNNSIGGAVLAGTIAGGGRSGGEHNSVTANGATVGGGAANVASGLESTVAGGYMNTASGQWSTVNGGFDNEASGPGSIIAGGQNNTASGIYSFAAGRRAKSNHSGSFVWADAIDADFATTASNQFLIRATGGIGLNTTSPVALFTLPEGEKLSLDDNTDDRAIYVPAGEGEPLVLSNGNDAVNPTIRFRDNLTTTDVMVVNVANGRVGIGTDAPDFELHVDGDAGKPGGGTWSVASDIRLKHHIQPLQKSLDKLLALEGVSFEYLNPEAINELPGERIGMVAQKVAEVFPDWVSKADDGHLRMTVRGFEALTVEALRELRAENEARNNAQQRQIDAQNAIIQQQQAVIEQLMRRLDQVGK